MQAGRILPIFRQFFSPTNRAKGSADRDPNQGGQSPSERDATEEEARRAAELLAQSEEFRQHGLTVDCESHRGKFVLLVRDRAGGLLRMVHSHEIPRILLSFGAAQNLRQGRILDRRI